MHTGCNSSIHIKSGISQKVSKNLSAIGVIKMYTALTNFVQVLSPENLLSLETFIKL